MVVAVAVHALPRRLGIMVITVLVGLAGLQFCHAATLPTSRVCAEKDGEAFAIAMLQHTLQSRSRLACFEAAAVLAYTEPYYHCFSSSSPSSDSATTTSPTTSPVQSSPPLPLTPT